MSLRTFTLEEKIAAIEMAIVEARGGRRSPGSAEQRHYEVLKSIAADLRARLELPRSNALGELERALIRMKEAPRTVVNEYDQTRMVEVTKIVISKWPYVSQALERFGEESAE